MIILQYLILAFFLMFFIGTGVAFYLQDQYHTRQAYVATFFFCLILVNIVGIQFVPIVHFHKFASAGPEEHTDYELRMVDAHGKEITLDSRAVYPIPTSRLSRLGNQMVNDYSESERKMTAAYVYEEAQAYRAHIESGSSTFTYSVEFPRHGLGYRWTNEELAGYDEFVQLRVYRVDKVLSDDGSKIETRSTELVYEWSSDESVGVNAS